MRRLVKWLGRKLVICLVCLTPAWSFADAISDGKQKAELCFGCHGESGISYTDDIPNLAGQKLTYIENQLKNFRSGLRKNPVMQSMAADLSNEDIHNLASFFSSLK